jgi:glutamine synthetase
MVKTDGSFATRHGLWSDDQMRQAGEIEARAAAGEFDVVRLSFADQHGILRGKTLISGESLCLGDGCSLSSTWLLKDTSHRTVYSVWQADDGLAGGRMTGGGDFVLVPDPSTFCMLPWADGTAWVQCDIYYTDGTPVPFSTRQILRNQISRLDALGQTLMTGLEVEFHVFRQIETRLDPNDATQPGAVPEVELVDQGYQYLTEDRYDSVEGIMDLLRENVEAIGLPLRSMEVEFGPSQFEFTFHARNALESADNMVLFRSAVKQVCNRHGLHATFMCRPHLANVFSSGWHLHQSLIDMKTGGNVFVGEHGDLLSTTARHYVGGLLEHARAASLFTTPTINGYKRFRPRSLAPDRAVWGHDNRGSMVRVCGQPGDAATRVENRMGEPAANPYLYTASQIICGLDGIENAIDPGPPAEDPYDAKAETLPASLMEAVSALRESNLFSTQMGPEFVDYLCMIKEAEISRFLTETNDWEMREYFQIF